LRNDIHHVDSLSRDALRATEKKVSLILVRESQSYLSWFMVSLAWSRQHDTIMLPAEGRVALR